MLKKIFGVSNFRFVTSEVCRLWNSHCAEGVKIQTRRLAASFVGLNNSIAQLAGKIRSSKMMQESVIGMI